MSEILRFPVEKARPALPPLAEVLAHPMRSEATPPRQSGQPAVLLAFPDGRLHFRSTQRGYQALQHAIEDDESIPLSLTWASAPGQGRSVTVEADGPVNLTNLAIQLEEWMVVHAYAAEEVADARGYAWDFRRAVVSPRPAPGFPYLWTTDFGPHGGLWLFGTPEDLDLAATLLAEQELFRAESVTSRGGELEALTTSSLRGRGLLSFLENNDFWLRRDAVWCDCH